MATQTQVLKRGVVQPARLHDYLYGQFALVSLNLLAVLCLDPACTLSGVRDHARETFMAKTNTEQVVSKRPLFILSMHRGDLF